MNDLDPDEVENMLEATVEKAKAETHLPRDRYERNLRRAEKAVEKYRKKNAGGHEFEDRSNVAKSVARKFVPKGKGFKHSSNPSSGEPLDLKDVLNRDDRGKK